MFFLKTGQWKFKFAKLVDRLWISEFVCVFVLWINKFKCSLKTSVSLILAPASIRLNTFKTPRSKVKYSEILASKCLKFEYSYFDKGWRKKCTRQCRKVLWVILSSQSVFNKIWKNGTRGYGQMCASTKGKQQKYFRQLQGQEQFIDHILYYISGLSRAHVFRQPYLK